MEFTNNKPPLTWIFALCAVAISAIAVPNDAFAVAGNVNVNQKGVSVEGATVSFRDLATGNVVEEKKTDRRGVAAVNVPSGRYEVTVRRGNEEQRQTVTVGRDPFEVSMALPIIGALSRGRNDVGYSVGPTLYLGQGNFTSHVNAPLIPDGSSSDDFNVNKFGVGVDARVHLPRIDTGNARWPLRPYVGFGFQEFVNNADGRGSGNAIDNNLVMPSIRFRENRAYQFYAGTEFFNTESFYLSAHAGAQLTDVDAVAEIEQNGATDKFSVSRTLVSPLLGVEAHFPLRRAFGNLGNLFGNAGNVEAEGVIGFNYVPMPDISFDGRSNNFDYKFKVDGGSQYGLTTGIRINF